jgi:3-deoxy-manno-octulosonate cytidylyltransferase (CMP-KDO synthetase)
VSFTVIIPARFESTRLPGKLLMMLAGKPLIQHVYERAVASQAQRVIVATDHPAIVQAVTGFSGEVVLTAPTHPSGTDRLAEAVSSLNLADDSVIVNVQGDEPLIEPKVIRQVAANLVEYTQSNMSTIATPIDAIPDLFNPNIVKTVLDELGFALYFSRAPVPWDRENFAGIMAKGVDNVNTGLLKTKTTFYRHVGIYAYRVNFLRTFVGLEQSELEKAEALEQLRVLSHGYRIHVGILPGIDSIGVDTQADFLRVKEILEKGKT